MNKLEGKIALITGGTSGIGLATAKAFVNEGADVFVTGRREAELATTVKDIGINITGIQGDVSNLGTLIVSLRKSRKKRADSILCSPMPGLGSLPHSARSPRNFMTGPSTSM